MTENLKRCPFCGNEAECIEFYGLYHVICCNCHIAGKDCSTRESAVSAWNNRPIEDLKDDENAWLEKNLKDYNRVMLENARLREALQMIATEKDNHGQWLSVEQAAQIAKDTLEGCLI